MSKFVVNVLKLFTATVAGQILATLLIPIISRLFSPADFGIYQLFISITSLIAIVSCLCYHLAIILPKDDQDAANLFVLCLILICVTTALSGIFFFLFAGSIERLLNTPGFSSYVIFLPLAIFCNSFAYVLGYWMSRREQFGTIAAGNLASSVAGKAVTIGAGSISPSPAGLIAGTIVNDATLTVIQGKRALSDTTLFRNVSFHRIKELAARYKRFPFFSTGTNLANSATIQAPPFLLAFFFSPTIVGYYAFAYMVVHLPSKLIGNSITAVFFQKASVERNETGSTSFIVKTVHRRLISLGIFICLVLLIAGPELFSVVLGSQWSEAGMYAQILSPWFFVVFISTPLFPLFSIFEKQVTSLWFNLFLLCSSIVVLVIGGLCKDPVLAMVLLSANGVLFWTWMNMFLLKTAGVPIREALREMVQYLALGLGMSLPILAAKFFGVQLLVFLATIAIMTILYYLVVFWMDIQLREVLFRIAGRVLNR